MALAKDTEHELELRNGSRIISLPASADTIVGFSSVYRLILDEAARIPDETYYAVRPMLAMSGGSILAISTPFGRRGFFYEAWEGQASSDAELDLETVERLLADLDFPIEEYSDVGSLALPSRFDDPRAFLWTKTCVPAPHNRRLNRRYLAHERRSIPDLWFRQEWLCEFVELGSVVFRYADLQAMMTEDVTPLFGPDGVLVDEVRVVRDDVSCLPVGEGVWSH
jgi:hypothetical protein